MATKTFKTRIQVKYDTYANWETNNPTPLSGEICVVVVPASVGAVAQEPAILFKVGNGTTAFKELPFTGGLAADVYDWAKAATKPSYTANEISGLADYIAGEIEDTDTQYKLEQDTTDKHILKLFSKDKGSSAWTEVASVTTADTVYDDTALGGRISAVETLVGNTAVATQIANAIAALDLANTYEAKGAAATEAGKVQTVLDNYIASNNGVVDAIKDGDTIDSFKDVETALAGKQASGDYATKAEAQGYANAKDTAITSAQSAADAAQDDVDALELKIGTVAEGKTVVQMIEDAKVASTYDDTAIKGRISDNETAIGTLNGSASTSGSVDYKIAQAVAKIMENPDETMNSINELVTWCNDHAADALELSNQVSTNKLGIAGLEEAFTSNVSDIYNRIGTLENDSARHTHKNLTLLETYTQTEANLALAVANQHTHSNTDSELAEAVANQHTHGNLELLETYTQTNDDLMLAVSDRHTHSNTDSEIADAVASKHTHPNQEVLDLINDIHISEWNKVSDKIDADEVSTIGTTGNIADAIQTDGDYIIFNCGSATETI